MRYVETVMGLPISVDIRDEGDHRIPVDEAFGELRRADSIFSTYRPDSEIGRLNRAELTLDTAGDEFIEVMSLAEKFSTVSGGVFTLHDADERWDLNGIVKGWAADQAAGVLRSHGIHNFCLNAGGDVIAAGHPEPGRPWNVGVRSPGSPESMIAVVALTDMSIATSGSYERGRHIVDGRTRLLAHGLTSVSVISADLTVADVLATTVYAMGEVGVGWAAERYDCAVLAVTEAGDLLAGGDVRRWLAPAT
jgi:thiamine biosynthesis lipoprotein